MDQTAKKANWGGFRDHSGLEKPEELCSSQKILIFRAAYNFNSSNNNINL